MKDDDRGTGRTTKQMQEAPRGAIFVWCNGQLSFPRHLAAKLGRSDLRIEGPGFFDIRVPRFKGVTTPVVVDHAAHELFDHLQRLGYARYLDSQTQPPPPKCETTPFRGLYEPVAG